MTSPLILDLETKYSFQDVKNDYKKLGVSLVGIYNYAAQTYEAYLETDFPRLFPLLESASVIIGFNIRKFDFPVLSPYYVGKLDKLPVLDLLDDIEKFLGFRVSLDDLVRETLGQKKNGHGFLAIEYYRSGQWDLLREYCLHDVEITRNLYEYGNRNGKVYFRGPYGRREIPVSWHKREQDSNIPMTLPF